MDLTTGLQSPPWPSSFYLARRGFGVHEKIFVLPGALINAGLQLRRMARDTILKKLPPSDLAKHLKVLTARLVCQR